MLSTSGKASRPQPLGRGNGFLEDLWREQLSNIQQVIDEPGFSTNQYIDVYVYMHIYIYMYDTCIHIYTYISIFVYIHIHTYMDVGI